MSSRLRERHDASWPSYVNQTHLSSHQRDAMDDATPRHALIVSIMLANRGQ